MPVTSSVGIKINFAGDVNFGDQYNAISNTSSPGAIENKSLSSGNNTISVPVGSTGCTIIPADDNEEDVTLKGVNGDTGIALAKTSPSFISLNNVSSFVINVTDNINLRLIWS